ncbi:tetratricopeptide repeat protein [Candidatus Peregrinibacteria bacterium]|nr:tetratricopeptide repeat protein [Candidatus Peregrinibacteria bacterium]MBI3816039.1 tetratricopeptide repeat protein [Candidatus Peregrinibacteria bacterium]
MPPSEPSADTLERLERAEQLKLQGKHEDALAILEELLMEDVENVAALEEIADNELSLGQYERAEAAALQAVSLDSESYTGEYILGFLRSHHGEWTAAIDHLRTANSCKANNAEILRCLGWALFCAGKRAQGIVTLERALNLDRESALTLCDLGVSYLQTQNILKAKALFERALDLEPENPRARECLRMAERLMTLQNRIESEMKVG